MTGQRRTVASVLSESDEHPDVEQLHRRATLLDPDISISTAYRTVRRLKEANVLERHGSDDGRARRGAASEVHRGHPADLKPGAAIAFRDEATEAPPCKVARRLGFELIDHRLELCGVPLRKTGESGRLE